VGANDAFATAAIGGRVLMHRMACLTSSMSRHTWMQWTSRL